MKKQLLLLLLISSFALADDTDVPQLSSAEYTSVQLAESNLPELYVLSYKNREIHTTLYADIVIEVPHAKWAKMCGD